MTEHVVTSEEQLAEGDRVTIQLEGREITVFNVDGSYHAYNNWCMHQSGPICEGELGGTLEATFDRDTLETTTAFEREGHVLFCPWHGWQYDVTTGECLSRKGVQLPSYPVEVRDGDIVVSL